MRLAQRIAGACFLTAMVATMVVVHAAEPGAADDSGPASQADGSGGVDVPEADPVTSSPALSARQRYNLALGQLNSGELEMAAEGFIAARDDAGPDPELRYRAAFNLGLALAGQSDAQQTEQPEQAIETLRSSAAWFSDAVRLAPDC